MLGKDSIDRYDVEKSARGRNRTGGMLTMLIQARTHCTNPAADAFNMVVLDQQESTAEDAFFACVLFMRAYLH